MSRSISAHPLRALLVGAFLATSASAETIYVCWDGSGDYLTIQEGIDAAQNSDTVLVAEGLYPENIDFLGKAITVTSSEGPDATVIDGQHGFSVVMFVSGEGSDSVLDGFTIRNGSGTLDPYGRWCGGGIYCGWYYQAATPTISNNVITQNQALGLMGLPGLGGGIYCLGGDQNITNCIICANDAEYGAGIFGEYSSVVLTNCVLNGNLATGDGGGMFLANPYIVRSPSTLTNCTFTGNVALSGKGGAIYTHQIFDLTADNCIFWSDAAGDEGPEIAFDSSPVWWCTLTVSYCDVAGGEDDIYLGPSCTLAWGDGNVDADPRFADPNSDDYHLSAGSACIDAGDNDAVPPDVFTDLDGLPRFADDPGMPDSGAGTPPIVDMGAYEFQGATCFGDLDGDNGIDLSDLAQLLSNYGMSSGAVYADGDVDRDGDVDLSDLAALLAVYGTTCE